MNIIYLLVKFRDEKQHISSCAILPLHLVPVTETHTRLKRVIARTNCLATANYLQHSLCRCETLCIVFLMLYRVSLYQAVYTLQNTRLQPRVNSFVSRHCQILNGGYVFCMYTFLHVLLRTLYIKLALYQCIYYKEVRLDN
jgi:hypothetical protein